MGAAVVADRVGSVQVRGSADRRRSGGDPCHFDAHLPDAGHWRLSYHVPSLRMVGLRTSQGSRDDMQGMYTLQVTSGEAATTFDFGAAVATPD